MFAAMRVLPLYHTQPPTIPLFTKVLVVDHSSSIRRRVRQELKAEGHIVFDAASGDIALEKLTVLRPDIITLDVDMPGISGYETCYRIRKEQSEFAQIRPENTSVPIVFLTSNDSEDARNRGYQAGANGFVVKPFLKGELCAEIDRASKAYDDVRGHTVLIAEDSDTVRSMLKAGLKSKGLNIIEATNGQEALDILIEKSDSIDMLLTDYIMPEMNGDELCNSVRNELGQKDLPIIFLSATSEKAFMLEMFKAGASDFLIKPFSKEELQARVIVHLKSKILGDQLRNHVTELKRAHKLKDEFLSICSHDLRAPLSGVIGSTQLLMDDDEISEDNKELIGYISSSSEFLRNSAPRSPPINCLTYSKAEPTPPNREPTANKASGSACPSSRSSSNSTKETYPSTVYKAKALP